MFGHKHRSNYEHVPVTRQVAFLFNMTLFDLFVVPNLARQTEGRRRGELETWGKPGRDAHSPIERLYGT